MKKTFRILFTMSFICSLTSCTWQLPDKVSIRTKATYNFCIGNIEKDFSEHFSSDKVISSDFSTNPGNKMYDYYPGKTNEKIQRYLMKMPIQDIPVDFSTYFDDTSLASSIKDLSFNKKIDIPQMNMTLDEEIDMSPLTGYINALVSANGSSSSVTFSSPAGSFTSVSYGTGAKMKISCVPVSSTGKVVLKYNGSEVSSAQMLAGKAELNMKDKTVYQSGMTIELPSGATAYTITMTSGSKVNTASGITFPNPISVPVYASITNGNTTDSFTNCVVGAGSIDLEVAVPSSWSNVTVAYDASLKGAITTSALSSSGKTKSVTLDGVPITNGSTDITSNVDFTFNKANITFADAVKLKASTNIASYSSISINLSGVNTSMNEAEPISTEIKAIIVSLEMLKSGLKGKFINTLPAGNDIVLSASSNFAGLNNKSQTLSAGTSSDTEITDLMSDSNSRVVKFVDNPTNTSTEFSHMDFAVNIKLPGADSSNPNRLTIKNVAPNNSYTIKIELEPEINWNKVEMLSSGMPLTGNIPTGLNLSQIFSSFAETMGDDFSGKVKIKSMPIYLYAVRPNMDAFKKAQFTGSLKMFYSDDDGVTNKYPADTVYFMEDGKMPFAEMPKIEFDKPEENEDEDSGENKDEPEVKQQTVISKITEVTPSDEDNLKGLVDASDGDTTGCICAQYNLTFSNSGVSGTTFTITKEEFDKSGSEATSIAIYAFIEVPLEFDASDTINVDMFKVAGKEAGRDLLGRSSPPESSDKPGIKDAIQSVQITCKSPTLPFWGAPEGIKLSLDWDGPNSSLYEEKLINMEEDIVELDEWQQIMDIFPLAPTINMQIAKGTFSVPRTVGVKMNVCLKLEMDPRYELVVFGGDK